jgi:hypothetical protein
MLLGQDADDGRTTLRWWRRWIPRRRLRARQELGSGSRHGRRRCAARSGRRGSGWQPSRASRSSRAPCRELRGVDSRSDPPAPRRRRLPSPREARRAGRAGRRGQGDARAHDRERPQAHRRRGGRPTRAIRGYACRATPRPPPPVAAIGPSQSVRQVGAHARVAPRAPAWPHRTLASHRILASARGSRRR